MRTCEADRVEDLHTKTEILQPRNMPSNQDHEARMLSTSENAAPVRLVAMSERKLVVDQVGARSTRAEEGEAYLTSTTIMIRLTAQVKAIADGPRVMTDTGLETNNTTETVAVEEVVETHTARHRGKTTGVWAETHTAVQVAVPTRRALSNSKAEAT
jgi:hypothetical protein